MSDNNCFYLKIYKNNFFYFLKIIFNINILKKYKNIKKNQSKAKIKKIQFFF
jgi:hypothetical protein